MKSKTTSWIGLDIGSHSIKCVETARENEKVRLLRAVLLPLEDSSPEGLLKTLKGVTESFPPSSKPIRIAVSGSSILIRRIALPIMTHEELKGAIRFEAEKHIPFSIEDCVLDFQMLNRVPTKKSMNVLLVAAKRDIILERLRLLETLQLRPELIDVDIFCLINAFETLGNETENKTYGLLNIGHRFSSFAIMQDKLPFFVREIPFGGAGITKALAELKGLAETEADLMKRQRPPDAAADLRAATQKGFEPLAEELRHSIDFFENEATEDLKFIWVSGGGALSFEAPAVLSEELGRTVSPWDNLKKMEISDTVDLNYLTPHAPELNVALGMVLRGEGPRPFRAVGPEGRRSP